MPPLPADENTTIPTTTTSETTTITTHKGDVRERVWRELRKVALPDSRFHYDFGSFIADFAGSRAACDALLALPTYPTSTSTSTGSSDSDSDSESSVVVFITPDNCVEHLRLQTLRRGVRVLTTTYGLRRGFWLLDPTPGGQLVDAAGGEREPGLLRYAATLDGMEKVARHVTLAELATWRAGAGVGAAAAAKSDELRVGFAVTGTGAISGEGVRFGKGHGYFDLEWAMMHACGLVSRDTLTAAVVHDCQVLDEELRPDVFDTVCDLVVTPTRVLRCDAALAHKPTCGILWDRLQPGMLEDMPPLQELRAMQQQQQ
ncbi:5-formyltetrahydrofolate cyclo-ligase [Xylariaceae sp. FL0804]|nr:5-formyltetrahydrofolate cyclo-ligase [Xylariaceae sp. FL0804]